MPAFKVLLELDILRSRRIHNKRQSHCNGLPKEKRVSLLLVSRHSILFRVKSSVDYSCIPSMENVIEVFSKLDQIGNMVALSSPVSWLRARSRLPNWRRPDRAWWRMTWRWLELRSSRRILLAWAKVWSPKMANWLPCRESFLSCCRPISVSPVKTAILFPDRSSTSSFFKFWKIESSTSEMLFPSKKSWRRLSKSAKTPLSRLVNSLLLNSNSTILDKPWNANGRIWWI